jgi:hypothetical protein
MESAAKGGSSIAAHVPLNDSAMRIGLEAVDDDFLNEHCDAATDSRQAFL